MKRHIVDCIKAGRADQIHTLHKQAGSIASKSGSHPQNETPMDIYVDRFRVILSKRPSGNTCWPGLFNMAGWAFRTIEHLQFVNSMAHVRPNFEMASERLVLHQQNVEP